VSPSTIIRAVLVLLCGIAVAGSGCRGRKPQPAAPNGTSTTDSSNVTDSGTPPRPSDTTGSPPGSPPAENSTHAAVSPNGSSGNSDELREISFDDIILQMQADVVYRPWMLTDSAKELDGRLVRIAGYMSEGVDRLDGIKEFVLLRNTECKFGPGGQADHLIWVKMDEGLGTSFTKNVIRVEGVFKVKPYTGPDGNTWSVYEMLGRRVVERR